MKLLNSLLNSKNINFLIVKADAKQKDYYYFSWRIIDCAGRNRLEVCKKFQKTD